MMDTTSVTMATNQEEGGGECLLTKAVAGTDPEAGGLEEGADSTTTNSSTRCTANHRLLPTLDEVRGSRATVVVAVAEEEGECALRREEGDPAMVSLTSSTKMPTTEQRYGCNHHLHCNRCIPLQSSSNHLPPTRRRFLLLRLDGRQLRSLRHNSISRSECLEN